MNWEQAFNVIGVLAGFCVFMIIWLGIVLWMMVDAQKRGLWGWVWAFVGLLTGPLGLIIYIVGWHGRYQVLEVVSERDELIRQNKQRQEASLPTTLSEITIDSNDFNELPQTDTSTNRAPIPRQYQ
jgi:hypothetical protein